MLSTINNNRYGCERTSQPEFSAASSLTPSVVSNDQDDSDVPA